jgi:hypothetical protein
LLAYTRFIKRVHGYNRLKEMNFSKTEHSSMATCEHARQSQRKEHLSWQAQ